MVEARQSACSKPTTYLLEAVRLGRSFKNAPTLLGTRLSYAFDRNNV